ncbi:MAG: BMP family ABC transporter substrate-binding protein [Betaproteobacteria bacterium]|nr:BMP family ABC transporter substrate-binding protein [Betaproteobacteria bacterium]
MYKNLRAALAAFFLLAFASAVLPAPPVLKAAVVHVAPVTEAGWVRQHENARLALEKALGRQVQTVAVENVAEGADAERVIRDLAQQGYGLIFTPSFGYMEPTLRVARDFPAVRFESLTGYKTAPNVAVANARYYEGRYLAGIAAGRMSRSGVAGYVAGFPIPEVLQGINAFALGMRSVRPDAMVRVIWLQSWFDPAREREAAITLMNQEADVLAFHTASTAVMRAAQERGRWAIAYHSDMRHVAPEAQLLAVTHHWDAYYLSRARAVIEDRWQSQSVWGGVREGMVRVGEFSPRMPEAVRREVLARQQDLAAGRLQVFAAADKPVLDAAGAVLIAAGAALNDGQIRSMNVLVQGVQGGLPR